MQFSYSSDFEKVFIHLFVAGKWTMHSWQGILFRCALQMHFDVYSGLGTMPLQQYFGRPAGGSEQSAP